MFGFSRVQWAGLVVGLALLAGYIILFSWAMGSESYNTWAAFIFFPVIVMGNALLVWRAARIEQDSYVTRLLILGLFAKGAGVVFRYYSVFVLYDGAGDANRYSQIAGTYYAAWREGNFLFDPGAGGEGTQTMEMITTALYTVIGPSPFLGFLVFGSFAFWGTYLIFRAFRTAMPDGAYRRYAALLFLLPSLLYWPSSIGKDSWLLFFIGVLAFGAARFFTGRLTGLGWLALGVAGTVIIRPHMAVLIMVGLALAQVSRPTDKSPFSILAKAAGVVIMVAGVIYLVSSAADFLEITDLSTEGVTTRVDEAAEQTAQGGSSFEPIPLSSPLGVPAAIVTILFRPFLWEADSAPMSLQSLEGLLLIFLMVRAWPKLRAVPRLLRRSPYLVFCLTYAAGFIIAFSGFSNFGILARQRVLMLPFFLALLALPAVGRTTKDKASRKYQESISASV